MPPAPDLTDGQGRGIRRLSSALGSLGSLIHNGDEGDLCGPQFSSTALASSVKALALR